MPRKRTAQSGTPQTPSTPLTQTTRPTDPGYWVSIAGVCDMLEISRDTLNKWRARPSVGFPPGKRLPNAQVRFVRAEVEAWLETLEVAA